MIRVVDNGCGIPADELPLAVAAHATSKLAEADDLFRVGTLGFRGEALASIAEVSRLVLRSRTAESPSGAEIEVTGGRAGGAGPLRLPGGHVRRGAQPLLQHAGAAEVPPHRADRVRPRQRGVHAHRAGARPHIHFTLRHNERPVFELAADDGWLERIARFFGRELAEQLIWVESSDGPVRIAGYAAHPSQSRSNNRMQYFFLNGRHIRDHALQHALGEAYRGLLMTGRYPIAFLAMRDAAGDGRRQRPSDQAGSPLSGFRPALQPIAGHAAPQVPHHRPEHAPCAARPRGSRPADTTRPGRPSCGSNWSIGPRARWRLGRRPRAGGRDETLRPDRLRSQSCDRPAAGHRWHCGRSAPVGRRARCVPQPTRAGVCRLPPARSRARASVSGRPAPRPCRFTIAIW